MWSSADDGRMTEMQGGGKAREALRINAYIMKRDTPLTPTDAEWQQIDLAYGGYVVEMGDTAEYADFAALPAAYRRRQAEYHLGCRTPTRWP